MNEKKIIRYSNDEIEEIIRSNIFIGGLFGKDLNQKELNEKRSILCNRVKSLMPIIKKLNEQGQLFNKVNLLSPDFMRSNPKNEHLKFILYKSCVHVGIKKEGNEVYEIPKEALLVLESKLYEYTGYTFSELEEKKVNNISVKYDPVDNMETTIIRLQSQIYEATTPNMFLDWIIFGLEPFASNFYSWIDSFKKSYS